MTSNALEETKIAALALTLEERAELLDFLENITLEKCVDIRSEWSAVARQRLAEHEAGHRKAVPFDSVFKRLTVE